MGMATTSKWTDDFTEDALVEQPAIDAFKQLGWGFADAMNETEAAFPVTKRKSTYDVVLEERLYKALKKLNPDIPDEGRKDAIDDLTKDRSQQKIVNANKEIYEILKNGFLATWRGEDGEEKQQKVFFIDWNNPKNNEFFLVSQLWISGPYHRRRPDLVGFVNGIPLVLFELKRPDVHIKEGYEKNLSDYKDTIPQLFWYNAFIVISNGADSVMGTVTSPWEFFTDWKKIEGEEEPLRELSLETLIPGICEPERLLDIVENFTLFQEVEGGLSKIVARYHQYFGVNNAIKAVTHINENTGKLGVFWHTQGSGKSFSMVFFSQKVLRKISGKYSFLIVTDRTFLDNQIFKTFDSVGAVYESEDACRATSRANLKELLRTDHRYIFTLIHKFGTEHGEDFPKLSDRSDIIVITDEAHRTQYDSLAENMRMAIPNAAFIGFTGTPLIAGEEKTRKEFGDYVSIYNFTQSVEDNATVPLYYENRVVKLQLDNPEFGEDLALILDEAELSIEQEKKLRRTLWKKYHIITREDRLEKIAEDIVEHYTSRGQHGKAMVISIDRLTVVKMYEKVQKYWKDKIQRLEGEIISIQKDILNPETEAKLEELTAKITYMKETDTAVVISQSQNEIKEFRENGLDIIPHRKRLETEHLDVMFKDATNPLRIVFVCAMWITGFDAKPCSTIYLDKPMSNHTLMQTIARANRVFRDKQNGLIVDYIGIFEQLEKALVLYGAPSGSGVKEGEMPLKVKDKLVEELENAIGNVRKFCEERGVDLESIMSSTGFERGRMIRDAADIMMMKESDKRLFLSQVSSVNLLFRAIKPHDREEEFRPIRKLLVIIGRRIRSLTEVADISEVMESIDDLLDQSVAAEPYVMPEDPVEQLTTDLSKIDFDVLLRRFKGGRKWSYIQRLHSILAHRAEQLVLLNRSRKHLVEKLKILIEKYNEGATDVDQHFLELLQFIDAIKSEENRHVIENMSEEELALFDILTKPSPKLKPSERELVREIAKGLLRIIYKVTKIDWRKTQRTRAKVQVSIMDELERLLGPYDMSQYDEKCDSIYEHVYDSYWGEGQSVYSTT